MNHRCFTTRYGLLITAIVCIACSGHSYAQSDGGLQLGQPSSQSESPTLDLGATAPADRPLPSITRTQVGDWEVACPPEGKNCAMAQIGTDSSGTPILEMVVRRLEEPLEVGERTAIAVLDIITPLGVILPEGVSVSIDGGREEAAPFQICTEQGCLVREPVDDDLIGRFKRGNNAIVSVIAASQGPVKATLSLAGFTRAYDGLQ